MNLTTHGIRGFLIWRKQIGQLSSLKGFVNTQKVNGSANRCGWSYFKKQKYRLYMALSIKTQASDDVEKFLPLWPGKMVSQLKKQQLATI